MVATTTKGARPGRAQKPAAQPATPDPPKGKADPAVAARITAAQLDKAEREYLDGLQRPKRKGWFAWAGRFWEKASARISRDEFEFICERIRQYVDGRAIAPADARDLAKRLFEAYTDVQCLTACPTCTETWSAILIVDVRRGNRGLYYSRSLQLRDPDQAGRT